MLAMFLISLFIAVISGLLGALIASFAEESGKMAVAFLISAAFAFAIVFVIVFPLQGGTGFWFTFAHWTDTGVWLSLGIIIATGAAGGLIVSENSRSWKAVVTIGVAYCIVWGILPPFISGPVPCNVEANQDVIALLQMEDKELGTLPEVPPSEFVTVSDANSGRKAQRVILPSELSQLLTYMTVNPVGYEQEIDGSVYNLHHLDVTGRWNDYVNYGGTKTPGYVLVNVTGGEATAAQWYNLPKGQELRYVPSAGFWSGFDLEWYFYTHYTLFNFSRIAELDGVEADDNFKPWYVATIMRPSAAGGAKMYYPWGVAIMDPITGDIQDYPWAEVPEWIDHVMPVTNARNLVEWYGLFNPNHPLCNMKSSTIGQLDVDVDPIVYPVQNQAHAQFVLTNMNDNDPTAKELIEVNLRTGQTARYFLKGVVPSEIKDDVEKQLKAGVPTAQYEALEPQLRNISGRQVWMFLVEFNGKAWGYAGLQPELTPYQQSADVIVGRSLEEFAAKLTAQDAKALAKRRVVGNSAEQIQITGVLQRESAPTLEEGEDKISFTLIVSTTVETKTYKFKVRANDPVAKLMEPGDKLMVTAKVDGQEFMEVVGLNNSTYNPKQAPID